MFVTSGRSIEKGIGEYLHVSSENKQRHIPKNGNLGQLEPRKMGPMGCHKTSLNNYQSTLRNTPEESNLIYIATEAWNQSS